MVFLKRKHYKVLTTDPIQIQLLQSVLKVNGDVNVFVDAEGLSFILKEGSEVAEEGVQIISFLDVFENCDLTGYFVDTGSNSDNIDPLIGLICSFKKYPLLPEIRYSRFLYFQKNKEDRRAALHNSSIVTFRPYSEYIQIPVEYFLML